MERRIEDLLVASGLVSSEQLREALELSRQRRQPLFQTLIEARTVGEDALLRLVAEQQNVPFLSLKDAAIADDAVRALSARLVCHYSIMPVAIEGSTITIAVSNPYDVSAGEDIEINLGLRVQRVFACRKDIAEAIRRHYGVGAETVERILEGRPDREETVSAGDSHDLGRQAEDASVVRLVNQILDQGIRDRATDVHFEMYGDGVVVRRRIDGVLYDTKVADNIDVLYPAIISRIKLMAGLNIVERRLPQDGRTRVGIGRREYDLRVSVVPTLHGENVVVRILPTTMLLSMEDLGLSPGHLATISRLIAMPHGIIFVTGPTGSGKSTTLYACLSKLNTRERKIITIEDPVEYQVRGLSQTQVNPAIGLTFARALRSMLRHDPDVMMVGEVRDRETAEVTIQTALTGHLVLSTLHTNDAAGGAVRLLDMGIDPYLVASSVRAFTAQRLVRVICSGCRESYRQDGELRHRGAGCRKCGNTGYSGRIAICEILPVDDEIGAVILRREPASRIRDLAVARGMLTLAKDGWDKVAQGITTPEEVVRVTSL